MITNRLDRALRDWPTRVAEAAVPFETRWTLRALRRVDPQLADRFDNQVVLYQAAVERGDGATIETHGSAMVRAYAVLTARMISLDVEDDAYMIGTDPGSGLKIAVTQSQLVSARIVERHGRGVVVFTVDELAEMIGCSGKAAHAIVAVKNVFPGAEFIEIRRGEDVEYDIDQATTDND